MLIGPYPYSLNHTYLGMKAQEERMNLTANNIANVNTPGYKKDVPIFEGYLVKQSKTYFGQGNMEYTQRDLDVGLDGPGFFQIETAAGIRYTRNGNFHVNSDGEIVTQDGDPLLGAGFVPEGYKITDIDEEGRVQAINQDGETEDVGQIEIVEFDDPNMLIKEGYDHYVLKNPMFEPRAAENTRFVQGYLEKSNVNAINESVQMIELYRIYEALQKIVHTKQEMDTQSISQLGKLA